MATSPCWGRRHPADCAPSARPPNNRPLPKTAKCSTSLLFLSFFHMCNLDDDTTPNKHDTQQHARQTDTQRCIKPYFDLSGTSTSTHGRPVDALRPFDLAIFPLFLFFSYSFDNRRPLRRRSIAAGHSRFLFYLFASLHHRHASSTGVPLDRAARFAVRPLRLRSRTRPRRARPQDGPVGGG